MKIKIKGYDTPKEEKIKEEKMMELKTDLIITENENENNDLNIKESGEENEKDNFTKNYNESANLSLPGFFDFLIHKFYFKCCKYFYETSFNFFL